MLNFLSVGFKYYSIGNCLRLYALNNRSQIYFPSQFDMNFPHIPFIIFISHFKNLFYYFIKFKCSDDIQLRKLN